MTLGMLYDIVRDKWRRLIAFALPAAVLGLLVWLLIPGYYYSQALVAPRQSRGMQPESDVAGGALSGLLRGAGMSLEAHQSVRMLTSNRVLGVLADDVRVAALNFPRHWDSGEERWRSWLWKKAPGREARINDLRERIAIRPEADAGLLSVAFRSKDAEASRELLRLLIEETNETLREIAITESSRRLEALNEASTPYKFLEDSLAEIAEREMEILILARSSPDYGLKVLDPPTLPETRRKLPFYVLPALMAGLILLLVVWREGRRAQA